MQNENARAIMDKSLQVRQLLKSLAPFVRVSRQLEWLYKRKRHVHTWYTHTSMNQNSTKLYIKNILTCIWSSNYKKHSSMEDHIKKSSERPRENNRHQKAMQKEYERAIMDVPLQSGQLLKSAALSRCPDNNKGK